MNKIDYKMNKINYKTRYENNFYLSIILLSIDIIIVIMIVIFAITQDTDVEIMILSILNLGLGITVFLSCCIYRYNRKKIMKYGEKLTGKIISAEYIMSRGENIYYLNIEFWENNKKVLYRTKGYRGNPNYVLESPYCFIYSYKGKYIEGNFKTRSNYINEQKNDRETKIIETKKISPFRLSRKIN